MAAFGFFALAAMLVLASCSPNLLQTTTDAAESAALQQRSALSQKNSGGLAAASVNGVMMQTFWWDTPLTVGGQNWWPYLGSKAQEWSNAGFTALWIPPAYKGAGVGNPQGGRGSVGYDVYDRYDLGEFNQKSSVATHYGTLGELQAAITAWHGKGIQVYADVVMNHMMGADYQETVNGQQVWTGFSFPGRGTTYSNYQWRYYNFNGWQGSSWVQWNAWDFSPYANGDAYDNLMGCEIRYADVNQRNELINWGRWITTKLNLDGYRLDATKHILTSFVNQWLDSVKGSSGRFAVSEAWFNNMTDMNNYAAATGGRTSLFDVPLHYTFKAMSDGNGSWDMRGLQFAGFTEANGALAVSFVENHDSDAPGFPLYSPIVNLKLLAYAYILTREKGYPCVYYRDYAPTADGGYGLGSQISKLMSLRKRYAYGAGYEYTSANDADVYCYSRAGNASGPGLMLLLNDGGSDRSKYIAGTPFKNATLVDSTGNVAGTVTTDASGNGTFSVKARSYSVWVPVSSVPQTAVTFNINFNNTTTGQDLYIVGSVGQLGNWDYTKAVKMSGAAWPNWTATVSLPTGTAVQYKYFRWNPSQPYNPGNTSSNNPFWCNDPNYSITPAGATQSRTDTWR